ncbi:MAG: protein phosphatase 2C family protein [Bacteroidales bacterium]|nr:protein phosphatase 2C family protein [Bacteroidales bacterium]
MGVEFKYNIVSISNFLEKREEENEDFIDVQSAYNNPYTRFSLCDGAGGAGVFCRDWAMHLAKSVPLNPCNFDRNTKKWFYNASKEFHDEVIEKKDLSDLILNKKVYRDGSYSTLTACWIDKMANELFFSSTGDSCVILFEKDSEEFKLKYFASMNDQDSMDESPCLLNWLIDLDKELPFHSIDVTNHFIILMASDSLAKWIILCLAMINQDLIAPPIFKDNFLLSINNPKNMLRKEAVNFGSHNIKTLEDLFEYLKKVSSAKDIFTSAMQTLYSNQEIDIDDYSLIFIEGDVS